MFLEFDADRALHSADIEQVARRLVEVSCEQTATRNGAVFLWDSKAKGLTVDFQMVEGVIVTLPGTGSVLRPRRDGRPHRKPRQERPASPLRAPSLAHEAHQPGQQGRMEPPRVDDGRTVDEGSLFVTGIDDGRREVGRLRGFHIGAKGVLVLAVVDQAPGMLSTGGTLRKGITWIRRGLGLRPGVGGGQHHGKHKPAGERPASPHNRPFAEPKEEGRQGKSAWPATSAAEDAEQALAL